MSLVEWMHINKLMLNILNTEFDITGPKANLRGLDETTSSSIAGVKFIDLPMLSHLFSS